MLLHKDMIEEFCILYDLLDYFISPYKFCLHKASPGVSFFKIRSIQCCEAVKVMKKYFIFTETDAQKFKAKFEECRNEVGKKAKKGKVVSVTRCHISELCEWLQYPGVSCSSRLTLC